MAQDLLAPAAVLIMWSIIMLFWMALTRLPAMQKLGGLGTSKPGGRGVDLEGVIPDKINWKSHNYTHLMEQPTLFYAVTMILVLMSQFHQINIILAWAYVFLRIAHSIWQALINTVMIRFTLFVLSTICLLGLSIHAVIATIH